MKRLFLSAIALLLVAANMEAKVELPSILGNNMVLQQKTDVSLWGKAEPKSKVIITPSWEGAKSISVKADKNGKWSAKIQTPAAGGPYEITFDDGTPLTLKNILLGEVWFCSGQSNMSMPMKGFPGQRIEGALEEMMEASPETPIRMCMVGRAGALEKQEDCKVSWKQCTPQAVAAQGAVSYYFAKYLYRSLRVPIGIVNSSWGGSKIEAWIREDILRKKAYDRVSLKHLDEGVMPEKKNRAASVLYNGMVAPLVPFTFKGMIWYQGEADIKIADIYADLTVTMVEQLRSDFQRPDLGFYCVQIAPFWYNHSEKTDSPILQEAQAASVRGMKHAGIATTLDVGDEFVIHPARKKEVGQRLAALALNNEYGLKGFIAKAPEYTELTINEEGIVLAFDSFIGPLNVDLPGFEVAGADQVFHPATARVVSGSRKAVKVTCPEVENPVAVRYAFHNFATASLFSNYGIPVGPFRTDKWEK